MIQYHFLICGVSCRISSAGPLRLDEHSRQFQCMQAPQTAGVELTLQPAERLALPDASPAGVTEHRAVWQSGLAVTRCCRMLRDAPWFSRVDYQLDRPGQARYSFSEENWSWLSSLRCLWFGSALQYLLLPFRTLIFHAAYIGYQGRGILFTAPSGIGKSTQAELWRVHRDAQVLNGDKAGVRLEGVPTVHGVPFAGTSGICVNRSLPLGAVAVLSQAPVNSARRLGPGEAAAALCPNLFADHTVPEEWRQALNLLLDLVSAVPVYALACTPDVRAVEALEQAMEQS